MSFQNPRQFSHMISRDFTLLDKLFETAEYKKKTFSIKKESNRNLAISNKKQTNKQTSEIQIFI